jgi:chromodomain-helicase-DNA-binding protein 7
MSSSSSGDESDGPDARRGTDDLTGATADTSLCSDVTESRRRGSGSDLESEGESISEEEEVPEILVVERILGTRDDGQAFFVKFANKSHIHCRWLTQFDLLITQGGESALTRFKNKSHKNVLTASLSIPSLLTFSENFVDSLWFEVDRVIGQRADGSDHYFLIKWKGQDYCDATWERQADVPKEAIADFGHRIQLSNPKRIPTRWVRPGPERFTEIKEPLTSKIDDVLRDYQLYGVNWLRFNWLKRKNTILADEMGLGKTVQIVATLVSLYHEYDIRGPFLVIAPMSTLPHWRTEFERWSELNCVIFHGSAESRRVIIERELCVYDSRGNLQTARFRPDVVVTTYETVCNCFPLFDEIQWRYLVADEGHKLKNYKGKRYITIQKLKFEHCTILTGTPIQNDVTELWSLLHFCQPEVFNNLDAFLGRYGDMKDTLQIQQIQEAIAPLLLRRKKVDVEKSLLPKEETIIEVEMTRIQKTFYRAMLSEKASTLLSQITGGALPSLLNLMMQLRKICNHPYLIKGGEGGIVEQMKAEFTTLSESELRVRCIVDSSGKMILIDKLLPKLKNDGHKVLIFSQMVCVLDILEDFIRMREYNYERIDGARAENERRAAIDRFNADPDIFVFLLSTKAGGIGINLTAADTVIIYDSDWNPQNDVQAQARCHRIGQKGTVKVYRLITRGTYENEMFEKASRKLGLDHVVLDGGDMNTSAPMKAAEIEKILRNGVYGVFQGDDQDIDRFCESDIDQILERCAKVRITDVISGGGSVFAKAQFDAADNETNNTEFWAGILPKSQMDSPLLKRRRGGDGQHGWTLDGGRKMIKEIVDHGYRGLPGQHSIVRLALLLKPAEADDETLKQILSEESDDDDDEQTDIDSLVSKYGEVVLAILEKADKLLMRIIFFRTVERTLYFLQGEVEEWPVIEPVWGNPSAEYSLVFALHRFGCRRFSQLFEDPDYDLGQLMVKPLTRDQAISRVKQLMREFEKQFDFDIVPGRFVPMKPLEWRAAHPSLGSRSVLFAAEVNRLFHGVRAIGLPRNPDGSVNWVRFREFTHLSANNDAALNEVSDQMIEFAETVKSETDTLHFEGFDQLEALQGRIKAKDVISFKEAITTAGLIQEFVDRFEPVFEDLIERAPQNKRYPEWWSAEFDKSLIYALYQYGLICVSSWLVDPVYPFRSKIPPSALKGFQKAAAKEVKKEKLAKPKDRSVYAFIYRKNSRLSRASIVIDYVLKRMDRRKAQESIRKRAKWKIKPSADGKYACIVSQHLKIVSFGRITLASFRTKQPTPVGFKAERTINDKMYVCEVDESEGRVEFTVMNEEGERFVERSVNDVWTKALRMGDTGCKKGAMYFGLKNSRVKGHLEEMEKEYKVGGKVSTEKKMKVAEPKATKKQHEEFDGDSMTPEPFVVDVKWFPFNMFRTAPAEAPAVVQHGEERRTRNPRMAPTRLAGRPFQSMFQDPGDDGGIIDEDD